MDKAALGYDYKGETEKHQSQKGVETLVYIRGVIMHQTNQICLCLDYSAGFGGRYGVQADRMDKVSITAIEYN